MKSEGEVCLFMVVLSRLCGIEVVDVVFFKKVNSGVFIIWLRLLIEDGGGECFLWYFVPRKFIGKKFYGGTRLEENPISAKTKVFLLFLFETQSPLTQLMHPLCVIFGIPPPIHYGIKLKREKKRLHHSWQ